MTQQSGSSRSALLLAVMCCLFWIQSKVIAATYHIRTDGGSAEQCTGLADNPYPGSGTGVACAWAHPFWALNTQGQWRISGGDTLIIGNGAYQMGYGAPNTGWCDPYSAFDCTLPPLPSGPSASTPTRILGAGHDSGCASPPELWGTQRAWRVIDLSSTSHAVLDCLEVTDRSGCVEFHSDQSVSCQRDTFPFGDWASIGIYGVDSSDVTLRNLNIHGLAETGVRAGRLTNWTLENVRIAANGWAGWDGDVYGDDSNSGAMTFRKVVIEWNGCAETYPGKIPDHCWAQSAGGYGDGLGTGATGGHWVVEDSVIRYNTSDGLDLLYVNRVPGVASSVTVARTIAIGNAGNQIKIGGPSSVVNSVMVGNCGFFHGQPFAPLMGSGNSGDHCRAGGATYLADLGNNAAASVVNSTITGQGDVLVSTECEHTACSGSESLTLVNNVFQGDAEFPSGQDTTALLWDPSNLTAGKIDYNVINGVKIDVCPVGAHDQCADPRLLEASYSAFDGHLRSDSPGVDSGLPVGALNGLIPDHDFENNPRPSGVAVDRGAYERTAGLPAGGSPAITAVLEGAAYGPAIAPNSWITVFGTDLSTITRAWETDDFVRNRLPTSLSGVGVQFNGLDAPVYYVSPGQINVLAPSQVALGPVQVTVSNPNGTSAPVTVNCQAYAPGLFLFNPDNRRYVAAVHPDGVYVGRPGLFGGAIASRPALPGERILLYGTGFGPTEPPVSSEEVFSGGAPLAGPWTLQVEIGGTRADVEFAGMVGAGLYQFNVVIPNLPGGDHPVAAVIAGVSSHNVAHITVGAQ